MALKAVQFLALVLTAIALVPAGAHLFALANKIGLAQEQYFIVQNIYRGWANFVLAVMLRGQRLPFILALIAGLCVAAMLAIFFTWTYPANQATDNWTAIPADWEPLRRQWEYSHAANALVTFAAFCSVALSVLTTRE
jgi:tetrahydromethanopterin S-methyltransferase subunit E